MFNQVNPSETPSTYHSEHSALDHADPALGHMFYHSPYTLCTKTKEVEALPVCKLPIMEKS